jgi:hypothetical protein
MRLGLRRAVTSSSMGKQFNRCACTVPKAAPFNMRLSDVTDRIVSEEALRTRRPPGIALRGSDWNRRPWVIGTALDVWEIVDPVGSIACALGRGLH